MGSPVYNSSTTTDQKVTTAKIDAKADVKPKIAAEVTKPTERPNAAASSNEADIATPSVSIWGRFKNFLKSL